MRAEFTVAQLGKLSRLDSQRGWLELLDLVSKGGVADFTDEMQHLKLLGLVSKVGPIAYAKFAVNGVIPKRAPQVTRKNTINEVAAFLSVWRKRFGGYSYMSGADMSAIKRFTMLNSVDEFKELVKRYAERGVDEPSVKHLWTLRGRLSKQEQTDEEAFS
jgi:hypothetical protein